MTDNFSLRDEAPGGAARRAALVGRLVAAPPARIGGERVTAVREPGAATCCASTSTDGIRVVVRPSGTEPKLKCYCEAVEPVGDGDLEGGPRRARARASRGSARAWRPCSSPDARSRRVPRSSDAHPRP